MAAGTAALARGEWAQARSEFEAALAERESPKAREALGRACWRLDDVEALSEARERAYRLFRGEEAVFNGCTQRAPRLLADIDECPEHVMMAVHEAVAEVG